MKSSPQILYQLFIPTIKCCLASYPKGQWIKMITSYYFLGVSMLVGQLFWNWLGLFIFHLTLCNPMDWLYHSWSSPGQILEWVAFSFSSRSFQLRDHAQVSHITGRFLISWAKREAQLVCSCSIGGNMKAYNNFGKIYILAI